MTKQTFTVSGQSVTVEGQSCYYFVDMTTPGGTGSVQLQIKLNDDWVPADTPQTATMAVAELADAVGHKQFRLDVTVTTGSIVTYLLGAP